MLTPVDLETTVFRRGFRGYSTREVQIFMEKILTSFETYEPFAPTLFHPAIHFFHFSHFGTKIIIVAFQWAFQLRYTHCDW